MLLCHPRAQPYLTRPVDAFVCRPLPGCVMPAKGFPTLHTLPLSVIHEKVGVSVFGQGASKKESTVIVVANGRTDELTGEELPLHKPGD